MMPGKSIIAYGFLHIHLVGMLHYFVDDDAMKCRKCFKLNNVVCGEVEIYGILKCDLTMYISVSSHAKAKPIF